MLGLFIHDMEIDDESVIVVVIALIGEIVCFEHPTVVMLVSTHTDHDEITQASEALISSIRTAAAAGEVAHVEATGDNVVWVRRAAAGLEDDHDFHVRVTGGLNHRFEAGEEFLALLVTKSDDECEAVASNSEALIISCYELGHTRAELEERGELSLSAPGLA